MDYKGVVEGFQKTIQDKKYESQGDIGKFRPFKFFIAAGLKDVAWESRQTLP